MAEPVPALLSPDQATMLLSIGMMLESARRGDSSDLAIVRLHIEGMTASLNSPSVDYAVAQALDAFFPADVDEAPRALEAG